MKISFVFSFWASGHSGFTLLDPSPSAFVELSNNTTSTLVIRKDAVRNRRRRSNRSISSTGPKQKMFTRQLTLARRSNAALLPGSSKLDDANTKASKGSRTFSTDHYSAKVNLLFCLTYASDILIIALSLRLDCLFSSMHEQKQIINGMQVRRFGAFYSLKIFYVLDSEQDIDNIHDNVVFQ